jgi:hypothetical protein
VRAGEARERAPLLGPVLRPFPWSCGQPCVLGSRHQPREPLPVLGWGGDLGRAVLGTGVRCEGEVLVSASICPRPHQLRALSSERGEQGRRTLLPEQGQQGISGQAQLRWLTGRCKESKGPGPSDPDPISSNLCVGLHYCSGASSSCCRMLRLSYWFHSSTILPSSMRWMVIPSCSNCLPVGGPNSSVSPWCVPLTV